MKLLLLIAIVCLGYRLGTGSQVNRLLYRRGLLGGYYEKDVNSLSLGEKDKGSVANATAQAIKIMNDVKTEGGRNNARRLHLIRLLKEETQVVAGTNYKLTVELDIDSQEVQCNLIVSFMYPWINEGTWSLKAATENDPCAPFITPRPKQQSLPLLGGENVVDTSDAMVQEAAQWAMEHVNKMSNSMFMQTLLKVTRVTKQVVNGVRYHFLLTTAFTTCRNKPENHHKILEECPAAVDQKPQECDISVIYSQGKYRADNIKCKPQKRAIGGDSHDYVPHGKAGTNVKHMEILGGDTHDYLPHTDDKCSQYVQAFTEFKSTHNRVYGSSEDESLRFKIFCDNMEKVKIIQAVEQGSAQYGATQFADLSEEEFKNRYLGFKPPANQNRKWPQAKIPEGPIPDSWDWRDHNAVTPVKNQGGCGSCWAFSTTGNIEGQWAINSQSKKLLSLSEQELVDCDKIDQGCNGGYMYDAYEAIMNIGGIETEADYKYTGQDQTCEFNKSEVVVQLTGAVNISKDEGEMAAWLYKNGPIAIGINAFPMQFYLWGIAHPWKFFCDPNALDHGVLIVGYGKKGREPYWIIKNSWGPRWGREGYYYIYRGDGSCGLNTMCSSSIVTSEK
jgi:cathepsin F